MLVVEDDGVAAFCCCFSNSNSHWSISASKSAAWILALRESRNDDRNASLFIRDVGSLAFGVGMLWLLVGFSCRRLSCQVVALGFGMNFFLPFGSQQWNNN